MQILSHNFKYLFETLLVILIIFGSNNQNYAQNITIAKDSSLKAEDSLNTVQITLTADSVAKSIRITPDEFMYADNERYTLDGRLPYRQNNISYWKLGALGAVYTAGFIAQHYGQASTIWAERAEFKFMEDYDYALWVDKGDHFVGTYFVSYIFSESLIWAGFSKNASAIGGALLGTAYSTYVEIQDGYGANWGFSPSDFWFNIIGSGYFLAQNYVPFLQNFTPKWTYIPSDWVGSEKRREAEIFIDDYSSHTLWMSVNVNNLLPEPAQPYWPDWLQLSFGYAARNLCGPNGDTPCDASVSEPVSSRAWGNRKFIIALDYDLVKLIPDGPPFINWLKQTLNFFKLPAPAIEFGNETELYLLYPLAIKINLSKSF